MNGPLPQICDRCTFYRLAKHGLGHREGECHRYPVMVNKMKSDHCGEFIGNHNGEPWKFRSVSSTS